MRAVNYGFSLIELMIGIVILSIVMALGMPSYNAFVQNSMIRATAESISNGLQIARAEAVKRNAQVRFTIGTDSNWSVGCVVAVADNDGDGVPDCPSIIQSHSTGEGSSKSITVTPTPATATSITFSNLGLVNTTASTITSFDVTTTKLSAADSRSLRITVGVGGNARMCDPNVSDTKDSRKC